jgi:lysophospholipid acyltransferase (LPLAT)-like uncharacterized protein
LLFARSVFVWGEPMYVPRDADDAEIESLRIELEARMNAVAGQADALCGVSPISPAALAVTA